MTALGDLPERLGCPRCGYVFNTRRTVVGHRCRERRCKDKPRCSLVPFRAEASTSPDIWLGICPDCGHNVPLTIHTLAAVDVAQRASKARQRARHLAGHRGRAVLACGYCRAHNPIGRLLPEEPFA